MLHLDGLTFQHAGASTPPYSFSMQCAAGEICGVMGQSGSGKSTLLDLISGFLLPSQGTLTWNGENLIPLAPEERPVTFLFQQHNLFDHISALKNVAIGINASLKLTPDDIEKAETALANVGLSGFNDRIAERLSGGEQQRVALARALVRDKPVILLDEPFSAIDAEMRKEMLKLVKKIASEHDRAIVMVTHDERDCEVIATRHYRLENGGLVLQT